MKSYKDSTNNFSIFFTNFEHFSSVDICFFSEALESKLQNYVFLPLNNLMFIS